MAVLVSVTNKAIMNSGHRGYSGAVVDTLTEEAHLALLAAFSPRTAAERTEERAKGGPRPGDLFRSQLEALADWVEVQRSGARAKPVAPTTTKSKFMLKSW